MEIHLHCPLYDFVSWYLIMCCEFLAPVVVLFLWNTEMALIHHKSSVQHKRCSLLVGKNVIQTLARRLANLHHFINTCFKCVDWNPPILNIYIRLIWLVSIKLRRPYFHRKILQDPFNRRRSGCGSSLKDHVNKYSIYTSEQLSARNRYLVNPYPTAFPYGNGMVLHFYQQQESSTTKTVHKVINKGLKTYV